MAVVVSLPAIDAVVAITSDVAVDPATSGYRRELNEICVLLVIGVSDMSCIVIAPVPASMSADEYGIVARLCGP